MALAVVGLTAAAVGVAALRAAPPVGGPLYPPSSSPPWQTSNLDALTFTCPHFCSLLHPASCSLAQIV